MNERLLMGASWLLSRLLFSRRPLPDAPRAVLVAQLDHIGDAVLAEPMLATLRRLYPNARIDVLCARWNRAVFERSPHIQRILQMNPRAFRRGGPPPDSPIKTWRALSALRGEYDLTVCVRGTWLTLLLAKGCWIDRGADRLEMKLRRQKPPDHAADAALRMLESRGAAAARRIPRFPFSEEEAEAAERLLQHAAKGAVEHAVKGAPSERPIAALHVGTPVPSKRWPLAKFAALAAALDAQGMTPALVGSRDEEPLAQEVARMSRAPALNFAGRTTLGQLAALLSRCIGFVGNDSAPMHIAAAVGVPTVGLFFASDPMRFGPRGAHASALRASSPHALDASAALEELNRLIREARAGSPAPDSPSRP